MFSFILFNDISNPILYNITMLYTYVVWWQPVDWPPSIHKYSYLNPLWLPALCSPLLIARGGGGGGVVWGVVLWSLGLLVAQQWAHVSVWCCSFTTGHGGCGFIFPNMWSTSSPVLLLGIWLQGMCPDRVGGWSPPSSLSPSFPLAWNTPARQTHIHTVPWLCSSKEVAKPQDFLSFVMWHARVSSCIYSMSLMQCLVSKHEGKWLGFHAALLHHWKAESDFHLLLLRQSVKVKTLY